MRVLALTRYGRLGASSRIRVLQYKPFLEANGIKLDVAPLFTDEYVTYYYKTGEKNLREVVASYCSRAVRLMRSSAYDLLWIEKELFPFLPSWAESLLALAGKPYVVDYDDAIFHNYDVHPNPSVRHLLGKKIDTIMRYAAIVFVGNSYLANRARLAGAKRIEVIPSVIDLDRYEVSPRGAKDAFTIGWIGSPSGAQYLKVVEQALAEVSKEGDTRVVLVGAGGKINLPGVSCENRDWTEDSEVREIQAFDVGIMPLPDSPWERGKCGFKLIQYMACGIPAVATPIGANRQIVDHGVTGFLAKQKEEWVQALMKLKADYSLRCSMGISGREKVVSEYSLQVTAPRLCHLLLNI